MWLPICALFYLPFSACSHPGPGIAVWDHPMDVMHCRRVAAVSGPVGTNGGFGGALEYLAAWTYAAGGTDLLLKKVNYDWSYVVGEAYLCGRRRGTPMTVVSVNY